jgi:hypothetical protein
MKILRDVISAVCIRVRPPFTYLVMANFGASLMI